MRSPARTLEWLNLVSEIQLPELSEFIKDFDGEGGVMPLVHTTDKFTLQLLRESKHLKADVDSVYPDEKLVYMFYGRPSYRVNPSVNHTSASFFAPVCLIFDRDLINQAWRIMPFDTGAHASGMLSETIHKKMELDRFALEVDPQAPMKLIRCFYGEETFYLENQPHATNPNITEIQQSQQHYVEAYFHLVHHRSNSAQDERVNAIEVQFNKDIPIVGNLRAVIVPSRHFDLQMISQIENEFEAICIMYDMPATYKPSELMNTIYEKVRTFILSTLS